jgi:hypothetical protein
MRRLLAGAIAVELVLGGLAVLGFAAGAVGGIASLGTGARRAALVFDQENDAPGTGGSSGGPPGRGGSHAGGGRSSARAQSGATDTNSSSSSSAGSASPHAGETAKGISFEPPKDFATGATPSSAEFNKKAGEQAPLMIMHLALSDSVVTGDFNADGEADVVQTNVLAGSLSIFLGDGRGGFAAPALHPVGVNPNFVAAGDLDGDGALDLAVADTGADGVSILRGDGKGGFLPLGFLSVPAPRNVAIGSIDGDGTPDLAVASGGPVCPRAQPACIDAPSAGGVYTFVGLGAGAFRAAELVPLTHSTDSRRVGANFVALHDFNGDGLGDLAVTVGTRLTAFDRAEGTAKPTGDDLLVFLNRGGAIQPFGTSPDQPAIRVGAQPDAIAVGDWDGDTHPDLATLETTSGSITSLLGDDTGHFEVKSTTASVGAVPRSLTVGDFDGDKIPDLVTASFAAATVSVLEGRGDGSFEPAVDHWAGNAPTSAAVADFDGDRRLDIVVGRVRTDQLSLLTNNGPNRGDGVVIHRGISYGSPTHPNDDPFPTKHTLDVYVPARGTAPFAGSGAAYPVVFFAHGGAGNNNKSYTSYLLRSLSARGIIAVSTNYRLGPDQVPAQVQDVAQAFRWTHDNIGSSAYGGDPENIVLFGQSYGGGLVGALASDPQWAEEQQHVGGLVIVFCGEPEVAPGLPETLFLSGDEGFEAVFRSRMNCDSKVAALNERGTKSTHVHVPGRDHFTLLADLALHDDPGRIALDAFLRDHLAP